MSEDSIEEEITDDTDVEAEMLAYFDTLNDGSGLNETENAVRRAIVAILGGSINVVNVPEENKSQFYLAFCQAVFERIPLACRDAIPKSQAPAFKFFTRFLEAKNNFIRLYLGYSKTSLETLLVSKGLTSKKKTTDGLIDTLASYHDRSRTPPTVDTSTLSYDDQVKKATIKTILERSFQQRLKGESREYCSLGHALEMPILKAFDHEVVNAQNEGSWHPFNGLHISSGYSCGLVAKAGCPYAKDSVDFLITVGYDNEEVTDVWAMEVKSRVTVGRGLCETVFNTTSDRGIHERIDDSLVYKYLQFLDERYQCLHHCYVYDVNTVVHAVADRHPVILQSTIIDYSTDVKEAYGKVLEDIFDFSLSWAYHRNQTIPDLALKVADEDKKAINSADTLSSAVFLWRKMFVDNANNLPLPSLIRVIPSVHAYWNSVKGGSDTSTKLMDDCPIYVPHSAANLESMAVSRLLGLSFVTIHRLRQIISSRDLKDNYGSLKHFRNAACKRFTFHHSYLVCMDYFLQKGAVNTGLLSSEDEDEGTRIIRPTRTKIAGKVPTPVPFSYIETGKTPKKAVCRQITEGKADFQLVERWHNCPGQPVQVIEDENNGSVANASCAMCAGRTSWYCVGCHAWFCLQKKKTGSSNVMFRIGKDGKKFTIMSLVIVKKHMATW